MRPLDRLEGESDLQWATRAAALIRAPRATGFVAAVKIASRDGVVIAAGSPISVVDMERLGFRASTAAFEAMLENGEIVPLSEGGQGQPEPTGEGLASVATVDLSDQVADLLCGTPATGGGRRATPPATAYSPGPGQLVPVDVAGSAPAAPRSAMWPLRDMVADTRLALEAGAAFDRRKADEQRARAEAAPRPAAPAATAPRDPTRPWVMP